MLAKQEDQELTTPEQAAGQYVADLSEITAENKQVPSETSSVSMPTSNVELDLQQDYQAQFSAAQAQAVAQVAAAMSQANNGAYPVEFASAVPGNPDVQSHVTAVQQPNSNELYRKTLISDKVLLITLKLSVLFITNQFFRYELKTENERRGGVNRTRTEVSVTIHSVPQVLKQIRYANGFY